MYFEMLNTGQIEKYKFFLNHLKLHDPVKVKIRHDTHVLSPGRNNLPVTKTTFGTYISQNMSWAVRIL